VDAFYTFPTDENFPAYGLPWHFSFNFLDESFARLFHTAASAFEKSVRTRLPRTLKFDRISCANTWTPLP